MLRHLSLALLLVSGTAGAHSVMTAPVPRNNFDDVRDNNALHPPPCGGPRGTVVLAKTVGDSILVEWDETIDHTGHYEIDFSMANDQTFTILTDPSAVMLNNIADVQGGTLPHHYKQMVKLPATPCPACTLRLNQITPDAGNYHSCADLQLMAVVVASPSPSPTSGDTPDMAASDPQPSTPPDPSTEPSTQPQAATPDMAMAKATGTPQSGKLEVDYNYGCDISGGAGTTAFPLLLFLLGLYVSGRGRGRIGSRYRWRR